MWQSVVVNLTSLVPVAHQPGELENAKVLGHCRLRHARLIGQDPHGLFAIAGQPLENRPPSRIAEGLEEGVGRE